MKIETHNYNQSFNTSFSIIGRKSRQQISKVIGDLNDSINPPVFIDVHITFYQQYQSESSFSWAYGKLTKVDHILGHTTNLNKFKKLQSILGKKWWPSVDISVHVKSGGHVAQIYAIYQFISEAQRHPHAVW